MVSKACLVGIYQRKLEEIARYDDVTLQVLVPPFWRDERGITPLERAHTEGYQLIVGSMALNGSFHLHFYPHLRRRIRTFQPHVVHIDEEPYNLATFHALVAARLSGCRTLWFSWQNLLRRYPPPFSWMERYCVRHVDAAIVGSQTAAQVWRAKGYGGPLAVIPQFGIDPQHFAPPERRVPGKRFVVGYAGRLVEEKGVDLLIDAVAGLNEVDLVILGSGPMEGELRERVRGLGISHRVAFRGTLPSIQMPAFYHQLDALVLPSRTRPNWMEQFGRVLIEAMACGVPVIGSNSGEIPHVIGEAGLIFQENDAAALRARLAQLVAAPGLRAELGRRGRERVLRHYTQAQVARQTVSIYRQVHQGQADERA
jgi:glycosyltransferase involved in cell wall biosynthesis